MNKVREFLKPLLCIRSSVGHGTYAKGSSKGSSARTPTEGRRSSSSRKGCRMPTSQHYLSELVLLATKAICASFESQYLSQTPLRRWHFSLSTPCIFAHLSFLHSSLPMGNLGHPEGIAT